MIVAFAAVLAMQVLPPAPPSAPVNEASAKVVLHRDTPVRFVTEAAIDSRSVRQGQRFTIIVAEDVAADGRIVLPKGARAIGEVDAVTGKGMFGKPGSLVLRPLFIEQGDQRIYLDGVMEQRGQKQVGGAAAATVLTGGFGLIITGKSATVPAGATLEGRIRSDVTLPAAR